MLVNHVGVFDDVDVEEFSWGGIELFLNPELSQRRIKEIHALPQSQKKNVHKQAEHIRYCINMAREYSTAAGAVSYSVSPVLHYYCCMWLATAEALMKQTGDSSFDRARYTHKHHGLVFSLNMEKEKDLEKSASSMVAKPLLKGGQRRGTFELWRQTARFLPMIGRRHRVRQNGASSYGPAVLLTEPEAPPGVPLSGLSLFDCLIKLPWMSDSLGHYGVVSPLVRATLGLVVDEANRTATFQITTHPTRQGLAERLIEKISFPPGLVENIEFRESFDGYNVNICQSLDAPQYRFNCPNGFTESEQFVCLSCDDLECNEFGYVYVALFICGSLSRYYPDFWFWHLENNTSLALIIKRFIARLKRRMPLLIYSELSGRQFVQRQRL